MQQNAAGEDRRALESLKKYAGGGLVRGDTNGARRGDIKPERALGKEAMGEAVP
jgi:hypothetical protein